MRNTLRLVALELKLLLREPMTAIFVVVIPLVMLYVLDGVFGNDRDPEVYAGLGASTFYVPTYVALSVATFGILFVPVHLATYRETGVLRRFRASSLPMSVVLSGHLVMSLVVAFASGTVLSLVALAAYDVAVPADVASLALGSALAALAFAALGLLLGMVAPSARAAQGFGILLFFLFLLLGGAGPPAEVLPSTMMTIGDWLPMTYAGRLLRSLWVDGSWLAGPTAVLGAMALASMAGVALLVHNTDA